jgi:hypothetical protein
MMFAEADPTRPRVLLEHVVRDDDVGSAEDRERFISVMADALALQADAAGLEVTRGWIGRTADGWRVAIVAQERR